ncbi:MAG TPA: CHRD domain-containing protein [Candidatus Limnocylindria bacterium]|nr:CHRD domain-containing protein [Candidatus Limnocylindria bacterium]
MRRLLIVAAAVLALALPALALAQQPTTFRAQLGTLNRSGVTGTAWLTLDGSTLTVSVQATGLEPGAHLRHIHGGPPAFAGKSDVLISKCPTPRADADGDGIVSVAEGVPDYGPVIVNLNTFSTSDGTLNDTQVFNLTADQLAAVTPLDQRAVVLHGMTGPNGYDISIPVACGQVHRN